MGRIIHMSFGGAGGGDRFRRGAGSNASISRRGLGVAAAATLAGVIVGLPALAQTRYMDRMMGGSMMGMMPGMGGGAGGQGCGAMMQSMGSPGWEGRPNEQWRDRTGRPGKSAPAADDGAT